MAQTTKAETPVVQLKIHKGSLALLNKELEKAQRRVEETRKAHQDSQKDKEDALVAVEATGNRVSKTRQEYEHATDEQGKVQGKIALLLAKIEFLEGN